MKPAAWGEWIIFRRQRLLLAGVALLLLALPGLVTLKVENDLTGWFDQRAAALETFRAFQDAFGAGEGHLLVFAGEDLFRASSDDDALYPQESPLDRYLDWVASLENRPGVVALVDPVGAMLTHGPLGGWLEVDWQDEDAVRAARETFLARAPGPMKSLISPDLRHFGLLILLPEQGGEALAATLGEEFARIGIPFHQAGVFHVSNRLAQSLTADLTLVVILQSVSACVLIFFFFRDWALMLSLLASIFLGLALSLAPLGYGGVPLSLLSLILFPLLFSVILTQGIHLFSRRAGGEWSLPAAMEAVLPPATLAALTTALGTTSFLFAPQPVVRTAGWLLPWAIAVSFLCANLFLPACFLWLGRGRPPRPRPLRAFRPGGRKTRAAVGLLLVAAGLLGAFLTPRLSVDPDALFFFPPGDPLLVSYRHIEGHLGGLLQVEAVLLPDPGSDPLAPAPRQAIERFLAALAPLPGYGGHLWVRDLPPEVDSDIRGRYVHAPSGRLRITLTFSNLDSPPWKILEQRIHAAWQDSGAPKNGLSLTISGRLPLILAAQDALLTTQATTFPAILLAVWLLLLPMLRALRVFLAALMANAIPLLVTAGVMALTGMAVNSVNLFVAAVMLGVVVDDTIHLLHAARRQGGIHQALEEVAPALWITSVVVILSFATLTAAHLLPVAQFGLLSAICVGTAYLGDLYLLPWLLGENHASP